MGFTSARRLTKFSMKGFICHVGFVVDGQPFVIPTGYGRSGDNLYIHGSAASRMLRNLDKGVAVCITVTLLDGLVLARSIFNHSMNYRSVVVLGTAVAVLDAKEKLEALRLLSEHILPGRWAESRQPNEKELKQTLVLRLPIEEFSAKVRQGPPIDDEEDYSFPTWAGVDSAGNGRGCADQRSAAGPEYAGAGVCAGVFAEKIGRWSLAIGRGQTESATDFHGFSRIDEKIENKD